MCIATLLFKSNHLFETPLKAPRTPTAGRGGRIPPAVAPWRSAHGLARKTLTILASTPWEYAWSGPAAAVVLSAVGPRFVTFRSV